MKKKFIYAMSLLMGIGVSGCSDFGDMNVDPSVTTVGSPAALLSNGILATATQATERRVGWYAQYFTESQYPSSSLYSIHQAGFSGSYSGSLYDLQTVQNMNVSKNMNNVAKIIQQYIFWHLTDRWGDIPYTEALQGQAKPQPVYDSQEVVYKGMIKALADASASMDGSSITGDFVYGNDPAAWRRLANSLRMLMAVQLSSRYPLASEYAATEFKAALADAGGYISTNAQNWTMKYDGANATNTNPIYGWYESRTDDGESKTMTDILTGFSDGRISVYGGDAGTGSSSIGAPYGWNEASIRQWVNANPGYARVLRADFRTKTSPIFLVTAAQVALAKAEAINLGWVTTENLATVYQQGVTLSYQQWGLSAPGADYFTQAGVELNGTDHVKKIATQQWVAGYPDGHIGWNVWRKTGFPVLVPARDATNVGKQIISRYAYLPTEYTSNTAAIQPALDRLKARNLADDNQGLVWWDTARNY